MNYYLPNDRTIKTYQEPSIAEKALEERINFWLEEHKIFIADGKANSKKNNIVTNILLIKRKSSVLLDKRHLASMNLKIELNGTARDLI